MDNFLFSSYQVEDRSYVSFIKREIHNLIRKHFNENRTGEIDIIVSELCSNLIKHADSGELLYRITTEDKEPVFEVLCLDNGIGMNNVEHSSRDGVSSTNTLGHGIGAITRLSNISQFYSIDGWGTVVYSKCYGDIDRKPRKMNLMIRCLNVAKPGETVSGDGVAVKIRGAKTCILLGDGLGHGPQAKEAIDSAIQTFENSHQFDAPDILREINLGVKKTRGLVGTIALLDHDSKKWEVCGIGNISTRVQRGLEFKNYVCHNGIIGLNVPTRLESSTYEMEKFQMLILCSDGIRTRWDLVKYPSILKYDPMIIAGALYKDHGRKTDDMTIFIAKVT